MNRKRGRPARYVTGRDGKPIVGLSQEPKSRRFYATGTKLRIYFGKDFDAALMKFRGWQRTQGDPGVAVLIGRRTPPRVRLPLPEIRSGPVFVVDEWGKPRMVAAEPPTSWKTAEPGLHEVMPEDAFFATVRELIITKPGYVAERTGVEQISSCRRRVSALPRLAASTFRNGRPRRKAGGGT